MSHRLPRFFYGPLLGFLLGALLTKSSAKTLHISGPHEDYSDHLFEKPPHEDSHSQWHPIQSPYDYAHPTYQPPPLTTDYPSAPPQVREYHHKGGVDYHHSGFAEEFAESNVNVRRQRPRPQGQRRTTSRSTRNPAKNRRTTPGKQRRRKTTTTEAYYYDYDERIPPRRKLRRTRPTKRQFNKRRVTTSAYEYDEEEYEEEAYDEYEYYEVSTVPHRKRVNNRKPQNPNRQKVQDEYELEAEYENSGTK